MIRFLSDAWSAMILTMALMGIIILQILHRRIGRLRRMMKGIPGPPSYPFIGSALELNLPNDKMGKLRYKYSKLYGPRYVFQLGSVCCLTLENAEDVEKVLSSSVHITKGELYRFITPWLGEGLLTSNQKKWQTRRKMLTPSFHFRILEDFMPIFNEQSTILVEILKREYNGGQVRDMYPFVTRCALDIISETAMGRKLNSQTERNAPYVKAVYEISSYLQYRVVRPWMGWEFLWRRSQTGRAEEKCLKILHEFTSKVIQERKKETMNLQLSDNAKLQLNCAANARAEIEAGTGPNDQSETRGGNEISRKTEKDSSAEIDDTYWKGRKRLAFLDLLIEAQKNPENNLTDKDLREEVDTFMFEGHDTTAASLNWTLFLLGTYKQHQVKVHEELDEIFGSVDDTTGNRNRPITTKDLSQMKYLELCIKESLRLYPSVSLMARRLVSDCVLDENTTIPAGVNISIMASVTHRNEKIYPDPESFIPERFLPENCVGRHPYSYIPFSAGPRNCIGQKFAMMEEKVILANVLRNLRVEAAQKLEDVIVMAEIITRPRDGFPVRFFQR